MNQKLALIGIGIVLASLVVALAFPNGLNDVNEQPNFIGVIELAEKIKNREDFELLDLRSEELYKDFRLPGASRSEIEELVIDADKNYVIYSGDDLLVRQFWDRVSIESRSNVYILYGGARAWHEQLLYPKLPNNPNEQHKELVERIHELSVFYGGFAEFSGDENSLTYYLVNKKTAPWPKIQVSGKLMRKGC